MRILAKAPGSRYSQVVALLLLLAAVSLIGERALLRGADRAASAGRRVADTIRIEVEPLIFRGGVIVSRSRHVIAGAAMGCGAGAAVGAGAAALAGLATGGLGWAAIAPAAGIGCLIGGGGGIAVGYPLDTWALTE